MTAAAVPTGSLSSPHSDPASHRIAITGITGMVGQALAERLRTRGSSVLGISRSASKKHPDNILWNSESGITEPGRLESIDTVVHLAGENIAGGRWNEQLKRRIHDSRVHGTRSLVKSLGAISKRPSTLICASAIGYYGDRGDHVLDENAAPGSGFLADTCREWEAEALAAEKLGVRVVCIRIGVVLSRNGGALTRMLLPFQLGLGGIVGPGTQYWSWIGLNDLVRIIEFCVDHSEISGAVNAVSPEPSTNREFTRTLGSVLSRPTLFPLPAFMARLVLGEMAQDLLLASTRVIPAALLRSGFQFEQPSLKECLQYELSQGKR